MPTPRVTDTPCHSMINVYHLTHGLLHPDSAAWYEPVVHSALALSLSIVDLRLRSQLPDQFTRF